MKYLIATCGLTHSGKTTFGERIRSERPNLPIIDSDLIYSSMCKLIPQIKEVEKSRVVNPANPRLRHVFLQETIKFFLINGHSILCTNGNTDQNARTILRNLAHDYQAQFVLIHFNLPIEEIQSRISASARSKDIFTNSNSFEEVLAKQLVRFEKPSLAEADIFYEINSDEDIHDVFNSILSVLPE